MVNILITERQLALITKNQSLKNIEHINEATWGNTALDFIGIVDPSGISDFVNAMSYFYQGDHLFGMLSLISAVPYAGDVVAKPVMGALKIGSAGTKELKGAMKLAELGKTAEASVVLAKLAEKPGVVGTFLQKAQNWAPKVASKVDMLPGGVFKGFKNTILDYLKLFENAAVKSTKFQKTAGHLAANLSKVAKPAESIRALKDILKNEKIFTGLTKKGPLAQIFIGGMPRFFGNRQVRILMRRTKWWLGLLDYMGFGNFVGPEELENLVGNETLMRQMNEYNQTDAAKQNAEYDFPGNVEQGQTQPTVTNPSVGMLTPSTGDPIQGWLSGIFSSNIGKAALFAI